MSRVKVSFVELISCLACTAPAWGHGSRHHGCCDHGGRWCDDGRSTWHRVLPPAARYTEPAAELETREAKVTEVLYLPGVTASSGMVEVGLQGGSGSILVRLAPAGFLKQHELMVKEGDTLAVTGYWVAALHGDRLVATEIAKQCDFASQDF
jgi:hypothetical protein